MYHPGLRIRTSLLALVAVLALIATSCGGSDPAATSTAVSDAEASQAESEEAAAEPAISLVASTVDGGQIDFGALEGQDVVLWFWAPW